MKRQSAERLANLLTLSHEPMLAWSLDGAIDFWNSGAEQLYGFASSEAVGAISHALLQTKFPIKFTEVRSRLRNERYWSGELRHTCKTIDANNTSDNCVVASGKLRRPFPPWAE